MPEEADMQIEHKAEAVTSGILAALKPYLPYVVSALFGGGIVMHGHSNAHNEARQAEKETLSGTNWLGKVTSDAHNEIWSNHDAFVAFTNDIERRMKLLENRP